MISGQTIAATRSTQGRAVRVILGLSALLFSLPSTAHASLLSPEAEDKLAPFLALFVLFIGRVVLLTLFWLLHILPERIAHKRHHPQFEAIRTLCLLSLVFGGLLWPLAWIWAYTKHVMHKLAYGTDKATHGEDAEGDAWDNRQGLHDRLARLEGRVPASELKALRADLDALEAKFAGDAKFADE